MQKTEQHKWQFKSRFRKGTFGWKSKPAILRVKEAVSEIKKVARKDPLLAAEGAVVFIEKISPALVNVDSSSGAIGSAVNNAIIVLVQIIQKAPSDTKMRRAWLDRLFYAHESDEIPYIELLTEYWGELCMTKEIASSWADKLFSITQSALSSDKMVGGFFHGTSACLGALFVAERYEDIINIVGPKALWSYKRWVMKALIAQGKKAEAIRFAEASRDPWADDHDINLLCEETLLSAGLVDEAYNRYGLIAGKRGTYLAWFRAVIKKYPHKDPKEVLSDLVKETPGDEGKWFAAAKDFELFDEAIRLANRSPCDPRTLTRAARDFSERNPKFATDSGVAALRWLVHGYGYEINGIDILNAYEYAIKAAENMGCVTEIKQQIRDIVLGETFGQRLVTKLIGRQLGIQQ